MSARPLRSTEARLLVNWTSSARMRKALFASRAVVCRTASSPIRPLESNLLMAWNSTRSGSRLSVIGLNKLNAPKASWTNAHPPKATSKA